MHYLLYNMTETKVQLLRPEELDATEQTAYAKRGELFLKERSILRHELARHTGIPAAQVQLIYSAYGKPECEQQPFNLSHSGDLLCIAFHHKSVGVDIERIRPRRHMREIAQRIMSAAQWEAWQARGCKQYEFYVCWCASEALVKWCGKSVLRAREIPFLYVDGRIELCSPCAPVVDLFEAAPGYVGAVAYMP